MYLPPDVPITATLARAPAGRAAPHHTLRVMRELVNRAKTRADIIKAAIATIYLTPEKDDRAELTALFEFVRDQVRYTRDVLGVETVCDPSTTLLRRAGDCDDKTALFCSLAEAVGYPTRFVMAGYFGSQDFEHVYCQVLLDSGEWVDADTTENLPIGYAPVAPSSIFIERV